MLHANVVAESTEHAQKYTSAKNKKIMESKKGKILSTGNREEEIIDLNEVLHHIEGSLTQADDAESGDEASSKPSGVASLNVTDASGESEGDLSLPSGGDVDTDDDLVLISSKDEINSGSVKLSNSSESKSVWLQEKEDRLGLIGFQDDIPDEVFEKMIAGEVDPWGTRDLTAMSHSDNDNKQDDEIGDDEIQSHDIKAQSHDVKYLRQVSGSKLVALILAPTRELAIQVHDHLTAAAKFTKVKVRVLWCLVLWLLICMCQC